MKSWVSVREAADLLQVSHTTVHNWIESGHLHASRIGPKIIRIDRSEIDRLTSPTTENTDDDGEEPIHGS